MHLNSEWMAVFEENKLSPAIADLSEDLRKINIFNAELYSELSRRQQNHFAIPNKDELYEIRLGVSELAEKAIAEGLDPERVSFEKIKAAILSGDYLTTLKVDDSGSFEGARFQMKAIIPVTFLTKHEISILVNSMRGSYVKDFEVVEVMVFSLLINKIVTEKKRELVVQYGQRVMLDHIVKFLKLHHPEVKISFRYGIFKRLLDKILDSSLYS